ncbi:tetratricopeptide repeat protein [Flavobacterium sp.]|uniref:tetratricopeptide repeat protein n=1 Tax=Flavobacterium sp. TaxID=239 RepID=UPI0039E3DAAD
MRCRFFHIALLVFGILIPVSLVAQTKKEIDSLYKIGTLEVYEHPDVSIRIGQQIYQKSKGDVLQQIHALIMISDAYSSKRDYQQSLHYATQAKKLAQQTDNRVIQIKILTKTATQCQQLKIYDKAIENLDEAERISLTYPHQDSIRFLLGNCNAIRGFIYKDQLNCDIAISYFDKSIAQYARVKSPMTHANLSIVTYNKGNCYIQLSDDAAAKNSFSQSIAFAKSVHAKSLLAFAQKGLAEVLTLEGKYNEAIGQLTEAEAISTDVGDLVLNQGIYKGLSENYLAVNQWASYQKYQQRYLDTQQQIKISERQSVSDSLDEQQKTQNGKLAQIKSWYILAILALIVLAFGAVVGFVFFEKKGRKKVALLQKAIKELQQNNPKPALETEGEK